MWPFTNKHQSKDAQDVEDAREQRDHAFDELHEATERVDRISDRIIADYEAEEDRLKK